MQPAAYAVINRKALQHNLTIVRQYAPYAKVMAVIKANAYGHGMLRVAQTIQPLVDAVAVARSDEGVKLRQSGFSKPVTVLEGFVCADELQILFQNRLDAVVHTLEQLALLEAGSSNAFKISVWLKLDSGMNRLGLKAEEFHQAYQRLVALSSIHQPPGLMTHLASADDLNDDKTRQQLQLFDGVCSALSGERSIANSAAILGWSGALSDWVRPGLMLYGCSPFSQQQGAELGLQPVMSLHSRLIAVKQVSPGETVGYGGSWVCENPTLLGVIAVGYGDGYPRHARPGTPVWVNGKKAPLIGRVSMDMITVDLSQHPDARPGDPVILWGEELPVETIACHADTIPYTLLCGITQRVQILEKC